MEIHTLPAGPIQTNAYLVLDREAGRAVLIDAPHCVWDEISQALKESGARLEALLLTHAHWDHTGDAAIIQATGVPVYAHEADRPLYENPSIQEPFSVPGIPIPVVRMDHVVAQGDQLEIAGQHIEVRHVPGHCRGNVLFYFPALGTAFVGDAIFAGSVGRTDFPGCSMVDLERSIHTQIYTLPPETRLLSGHGPATTVARERSTNPFVSG
ncbi:MAG TPA: MBL fold metallo-hydrolase [Opitutaceae bacterium]|nr:MBL fold metallo-hydrolase [Opitutaceae bacterium]